MTQNQFNALCNEYSIHPSIALENEDIVEALQNKDDDRVVDILTNEF